MRLIDADAFIQMMEEKCDPESTLDPWVLSVCRGGVKMMPTVDAIPIDWINLFNSTPIGGDSIDDMLLEWRYKQEVEAERERDEDGNNGRS